MSKQWLNEEALEVLSHYYYPRARWLQNSCNWGKYAYDSAEANKAVNDPLMQSIDIYDCFSRDAAGFSNAIQDLKFMKDTPKAHHHDEARRKLIEGYDTTGWDLKTWFYVYLCHRITGSGASFTRDHGYRNNAIQYWGNLRDIKDMQDHMTYTKTNGKPLFTSIGNQPPSPRKGVSCLDFMDILLERMGGAPRDNEDVLCDFVRFGQNYVPRNDNTFDHVAEDITNNSGWVSGWEQRQGKPRDSGIQLDAFM